MKNIFLEQFFEDNSKTTVKFEILRTPSRCRILRPTILYLVRSSKNGRERVKNKFSQFFAKKITIFYNFLSQFFFKIMILLHHFMEVCIFNNEFYTELLSI